jgi:hypothetical protein
MSDPEIRSCINISSQHGGAQDGREAWSRQVEKWYTELLL